MKEYEANFTLELLKDHLTDEEVKFYKSTKDCIKVTYKDGTEVTPNIKRWNIYNNRLYP